MKKRIIALVMGCVFVMTNITPIFATENYETKMASNVSENEEIIIEDDIVRAEVKEELGLDENDILTKYNTQYLSYLEIVELP